MSEKKLTKEELLAKSKKPSEDALKLHPFYKGKIQITSKCVVRDLSDFGIWYSPGVAASCLAIKDKKELSFEHTNRANTVCVISDCTRVLGLGDIGPEAGMPVMEGKCLLFKYLGGIDAIPLCLGTKNAEDFIKIVKVLQPSFGGFNLEDIQTPKCFHILDYLRHSPDVEVPIWHDDQQGTASVTLAGVINALKIVGKKRSDVKILFFGVGASNVAISRVLFAAGFDNKKSLFVDSKGIISTERKDLKNSVPYKWDIALKSNAEQRTGDAEAAFKGVDVAICLSRPGPNVVKKEWIGLMNDDPIVFACANPIPEIYPWDAKEAGARIVGTGRSDFANQVNNSMGFPAIFRGVLDVRARTISDQMVIAAAESLAKTAEEKGIHEEYVIPTMVERDAFINEAVDVALEAIKEGVARLKLSKDEISYLAETKINHAQDQIKLLMKYGNIPHPTV
ncbi:MAG: NADP-dependent malic enzyme [Candidatus Lokiarchaeota archaeon]|nr:NADP-dependent malic enzyme [Candidatus Lokiarchaeota archaeon]